VLVKQVWQVLLHTVRLTDF